MTELPPRLTAALSDRYRIEREIGSGGMATVYLAQDLKHDRKVAVKVLKPELAAVLGAERFLSEIKTTANLQHPHILPLFDSGEADGFLFYVMPFVEGESLRAKLDREKQLSVDEAVGITRSVASALDYAHRHGVIHRDIKPANILLHDGQPMVADFGIALAVRVAGGERLTETGLSLGTPQYMSPEQAAGDREVDGRSDLYSLGCALYEMLTGEPPHSGPTVQAVIARLLTDKPRPVTELRETVPAHVAAAVHKALAKLPADRFGGAGELERALSEPSFRDITPQKARGAEHGKTRATRNAERVGWLVLASASFALALWLGRRAEPQGNGQSVVRSSIVVPDSTPVSFVGLTPGALGIRSLSISRDGERMVFVGERGGIPRLYLRSMSSGDTQRLEGTDGAFSPFFSWDGESIGFYSGTGLYTMPLRPGSRPSLLAEFPNPLSAVWGPDDVIYCSVAVGYELRRISAGGGDLGAIDTEAGTFFPHLFHDGTRLITVDDGRGLWAIDLSTGEASRLPLSGGEGRYLPSGHLLYSRDSELWAVPFDPESLQVSGTPQAVLSGIRIEMYGMGQFDVSENGALLYAMGEPPVGTLVQATFDGTVDTLPFPPQEYGPLQLSPGGSHLALSFTRGSEDIFILDLERGSSERVVSSRFRNRLPIWAPDGSAIAFMHDSTGNDRPMILPFGSEPSVLPIPDSWVEAYPESWSYNGYLSFSVLTEAGSWDVLAMNLAQDSSVVDVATTRAIEWASAFSPDGRWMAYTSDEPGDYVVYLTPFPPDGTRKLISEGFAEEPIWSRDGRTLFYRSRDRWMAVDVGTSPEMAVSPPREVLRGPFINLFHRSYDVTPDARSMILVAPSGSTTTLKLELIQGWFAELEQIVPSGQ